MMTFSKKQKQFLIEALLFTSSNSIVCYHSDEDREEMAELSLMLQEDDIQLDNIKRIKIEEELKNRDPVENVVDAVKNIMPIEPVLLEDV